MYPHTFTVNGCQVNFREETTHDLESVWKLYSTLSRTSMNMLPPYNYALIKKWSDSLEDVTFKPVLACVEEDGAEKIIGRATLSHDLSPAMKHRAKIGIVVHDNHQGKGVGTNLLLFMVQLARSKDLKKVFLDIFVGNERALHVFLSNGFKEEGRFPIHYWFKGKFHDVIRLGQVL